MKKSIGAKPFAPPAPVWVVGTYDQSGKPNVMTASWVGTCCSDPPCVSIALRKATYSYAALDSRKAFTINIPSQSQLTHADYFGVASGRDHDKFQKTGLTAVRADTVDAPYISEFPFVLECKIIHSQELGLHTIFVGQIMDIKAEEDILDSKGRPDIEKLQPFIFDPCSRTYFKLGEMLAKGFTAKA